MKDSETTPHAFDQRGHFMNCKWKPVKILGHTAWTFAHVEFADGYRAYVKDVRQM